LAEAVGFEPTERFPVRSVSNRVLSASQPRLRRALSSHPRERGQEGKGGIATIQDAPRRLHQSVQAHLNAQHAPQIGIAPPRTFRDSLPVRADRVNRAFAPDSAAHEAIRANIAHLRLTPFERIADPAHLATAQAHALTTRGGLVATRGQQ
jgi:hypothetical protein